MTWALILWSVLMLVWIIAGGAGANCGQYAPDSPERIGCEAGTGIGIAGLMFLWFIGFVILALIWFMTRPKGRDCPVCGTLVKRGQTKCPSCGHDFAEAAGGQAPVTG